MLRYAYHAMPAASFEVRGVRKECEEKIARDMRRRGIYRCRLMPLHAHARLRLC